ncbi:unnamed protein product [Ostreobium quekettii]|uniref:Uncharacterized protein n=1 Tax=Ostreobium quekettii TaxID=121088 RepID=A0A8S1IL47_9CHLO|nr:unnamed protein product [Ostreobium quekettii]|eukprot:evm.model.scf_1352.6 EVM.evm.TU.scf_1352.6   scf_1352:39147-40675(+)
MGTILKPVREAPFRCLSKRPRRHAGSVVRFESVGIGTGRRAPGARGGSCLANASSRSKIGGGAQRGGRVPLTVAAVPLSSASAVAGVPAASVAAPGEPARLPVPQEPQTPAGAAEAEVVPLGNVFAEFWAGYNELLAEKPIMVKSMTSFFGFMIGDICAQAIMGGAYDPYRTARLTAFGVLMDGPVGHCWYATLDKNVMPEDPKTTKAIIIKTALDQLIWAPMFSCVFFTFVRTMEGHPELALSTIQSELVPTIVANYALWPLAHLINFRFVPPEQRILYINFVQILWTSYLSNLANNGHANLFHNMF